MKRLFPLLFFIFCIYTVSGQVKPLLDSLEMRVQRAKTPSEKADALNKLSLRLINVDNKAAADQARKSLELSKEHRYSKGQTGALNTLAILNREQGNYSAALQQLKDALSIAEKANDSTEVARTLFTIADVFKALKSYDRAIEYFKLSNKAYTELNDQNYIAFSSNKIAHCYLEKASLSKDTADYKLALVHYKKALKLALASGNKHRITVAYINLSNAYNRLGREVKSKDYLFYSLDFSLRGLKVAREDKDKIREGMNFANIGEVYEALEQYPKALGFYRSALKLFEDSGDHYWIIYGNQAIAKLFVKMKDYPNALKHAQISLDHAKKQNLKNFICDNYQVLSDVYAAQGNYNKAYECHEQYDIYRDSISNDNNTLSALRLQTEFESEKKDKEIELLKKNEEMQTEKNHRLMVFRNFLIVAVILLLVLLGVVFKQYRLKQKASVEIIRAKETAEQAKEVQEQFLANTSHEIRTPMNGIIGMTEQLSDTSLSAEQLEYVNAIKDSSKNLLVIINDLLDLSKIKAGKMDFEKIPFRLSDLFKNLILSIQYRSTEKNIHLISSIDQRIPEVLDGDPVRLSQVLLNLAGNAIKFTEEGEVKIAAHLLKDNAHSVQIRFSVSDTGIGIPEDKLDKIFESFTQVNATTTRKYGGTGLGLTIVKQIIEQQGGNVSVSSKVNEGSTFSFVLNFRKTDKQPKASNDDPFSSKSNRKGAFRDINILVVDDNRVNQRVATLTLEKWKAKVHVASDAATGISILKQEHIDLVLMDIAMPEMDGLEATKYIREHLKSPVNKTPIIAMTASALIGEKEKCIAAGMNDYISKPFNPGDLFEKIAALFPDKINTEKRLTDLSLLRKRAEGDLNYIRDILQSYITEMPNYVAELNECKNEWNLPKLSAQAHKMKSPVALVGASTVRKLLENIELMAHHGHGTAELSVIIDKTAEQCLKTVAELAEELNNIS
jgi:signal transduction histidine kinase/CheY-like chemotaxis protein